MTPNRTPMDWTSCPDAILGSNSGCENFVAEGMCRHPQHFVCDPWILHATSGCPSPPTSADASQLRSLRDALAGVQAGTTEEAGLLVASRGNDKILVLGLGNDAYFANAEVAEDLGVVCTALAGKRLVVHGSDSALTFVSPHLSGWPSSIFDTRISAQLLDGGRHGKDAFSFENVLSATLGMGLSRDPTQQLREAAHYLPLLAAKQEVLLQQSGLGQVGTLEFSVIPAILEMQRVGIGVDITRLQALVEKREGEAEAQRHTIERALGVAVSDHDGLKRKLSDVLRIQLEGTDRASLAPYANVPLVQSLILYRRFKHFVQDIGPKVLESTGHDGRVRAHFDQLGSATGRMSAHEPNLLGIPKDPNVRGCFVASPGYLFVRADYKTLELRVLAELTRDLNLVDVFHIPGPEGDPHRVTAAQMLGVSPAAVTRRDRDAAKPVNFGTVLGASPRGLVAIAAKNFGMVLTVERARAFQDAFFARFPGVRAWQQQMAVGSSVLRTASGRLRYVAPVDEEYNARLATPVQGTAADGFKAAIAMLYPELQVYGAHLVLAIHDELLVEVPEQWASKVRDTVVSAMQTGMSRFVSVVPIEVEASICATWAA